ncbi:MAG: hypothetical protein WCF33_16200 [Pseudonocardiaceae bacterium]
MITHIRVVGSPAREARPMGTELATDVRALADFGSGPGMSGIRQEPAVDL